TKKTKTNILQLSIFILLLAGLVSNTYATSVEIRAPLSKECNQPNVSIQIDLQFDLTHSQVLILRLQKTSCSYAFINGVSESETVFSCGHLNQLYLFGRCSVSVSPVPQNCKSIMIARYIILEVAVVLPKQMVSVGENVTVYSKILNLRQYSEFFIVTVSCSISFGKSSPVSVETYRKAPFYHQFLFPQRQDVWFSCEIPGEEIIRAYGAVNVESNLNIDNLKITSRSQPTRFLTDTTLLFQYIYQYPIQHCFVLRTYQSCDRTKTFSQTKYENKDLIDVQFQLTTDIQSSIGPGIHPFTLFMQNNISDVKYISTVWINKQVTGIKVTCDLFVGIYPNQFIINITLEEGCPANITIEINKYPNNELVSQMKTLCSNPDECKLVQVKTSLKKAGEKYKVTVFANNQISNDSAVSQVFETVPQIYDAYMTSDGPLYANVPTN
uniref:ZP domain-containing protein n=1 Tax=Ciona intestinalis TaxID=7719 RepID=H2XSL0_CIOIN